MNINMNNVILNIKQVNYPFMWCYEKAVATIASYIKRNYEMSFCELWKFDFNPNQQSFEAIGDKILIKLESQRIQNLLKEYHGIEFKNLTVDNNEVCNIAYNEIGKGNVILTEMKTPHFLWDENKSEVKGGYTTLLLVTGFSNQNESFSCIDLHNNRCGEIEKDLFLNSCNNCTIYDVVGEDISNLSYKYKLQDIINTFYKSNYYDNSIAAMYDLANIVENSLDIKSEVNGIDVFNHSQLISNFDLLMRTRGLFSLTVKFIAEKYQVNPLIDIYKKFNVASNLWSMASKVCIKAYYSGKDIRNIVSEKIREAADIELDIMNEMSDILNNKRITSDSMKTTIHSCLNQTVTTEDKVIYLDLKNFFNNKGFSINNETNGNIANFTGLGEYFINDNIPNVEYWKTGNMRFKVPVFSECNNDNILCEGQVIEVPRVIYNTISFLECSDWGNFTGNLTINFDDNDCENIVLKFSDWYGSGENYYQEEIAWIGENIDCKLERNKSRIYASSYEIKSKKPIRYITLPNCPNMHIFAISLESLR